MLRLARTWTGATILALTFVLASAVPALAAVTIGNVTNAIGGGIFTHNNNGNLLLVIGTRRSDLSYNITSASYNGVPLIAVPNCRRANSTAGSVIAFYLVNPPQGSHTIATSGGVEVVVVQRLVKHPQYKKYVKRRAKYKAHDEQNGCGIGDRVVITETRPLSKDKRWRVRTIVEKAS